MILVKYIEILDVSCTVDEILGLAKVSRLAETLTGSNQVQRSVKMSAGVVVEFGPWGSGLYSGFSVVESDIYCWIWCHMFVKTVRMVRLRYAFTQIVMIRSHFHCRNTVSKYWYLSETTQSFQHTSHPTKAAVFYCYVAICDRRNLWRCRNLWLKVSQFVTGVAICDGKCRNLWQRQNMQFNDIYSLNSINILFFHLTYTNVRLISPVCP